MFQTTNGWTKDKIKAHIKAEFKGKSVEGSHCLYRGPDGKKCGMGMFIKDHKYSPVMDDMFKNNSAWYIIDKYDLYKDMPMIPEGMNRLQVVHDASVPEKTLDSMLKFVDEQVED